MTLVCAPKRLACSPATAQRITFLVFVSGSLVVLLMTLLRCHRGSCLGWWSESGAATAPGPMQQQDLGANHNLSTSISPLIAAAPHFLIAGVQKSGTSALYFGLCLHPNVTCAAYVKEPFYLSLPVSIKYLQKYESWVNEDARARYHFQYVTSCFNTSLLSPTKLTLEASTTYFESDTALDVIDKHLLNNKHIRVIVLLRDPISRAYSQYQHDLRKNGIGPGQFDKDNPFHSKRFESFATAVADELAAMKYCRKLDEMANENGLAPLNEPFEYASFYACIERSRELLQKKHKKTPIGYLFKGLYYARVQKWMKTLGDRFMVLLYDDLRGDPLAAYEKLEAFLGIPHFDYTYSLESLQHEYQEGSRYEKYSGPIVRELAKEFAVHNELLGHLIEQQIPWDEKLTANSFVIPI